MNKKIGLIAVLGALIAAARLFARSPDLVEGLYAESVYGTISSPLSRLTGIFPFSAAEAAMAFLVLWLLVLLIRGLHPGRRETRSGLFDRLLTPVIVIGLLYLAFLGLWGLNYYRQGFAEMAGLRARAVSLEELEDLGQSLTERANHLRAQVEEGPDGAMRLSRDWREAFDQADRGYARLADDYPQLAGRFGKPKALIFSRLISYTGMYGFYMPFTGEANINTAIPDSMIPFSACHEMAHQRGIAREDEANFVGYLSCSRNPQTDFQYSGVLMALIYVQNDLGRRDEESLAELRKDLAPGVIRDLRQIREFGEKHRGLWNRVSERINDVYLKSNSQTAGVGSYGGMVELLAAFHRPG